MGAIEYKPTDSAVNKSNVNAAISVTGRVLGVWVESAVIHKDGKNILEAAFKITPDSLTDLLDSLHKGFGSGFIDSPLCKILGEINCCGTMLWQSNGPFAAVGKFKSLSLGVVRSGSDTLLLLRCVSGELLGLQNNDFSKFCQSLLNVFGSVKLLFGYKSGNIDITGGKKLLSKLDAALCEFELPNKGEINDASVVAFAEVQPNMSDLNFFKGLAQLLPDGTRASLTAAFGSSWFVMLRIAPDVNDSNAVVNIKNLDCSLVLNGATAVQLSGRITVNTGNRELSFLIDSKASSYEFSMLAEYEDRSLPAFSDGFFSLNDLALEISLKNGTLIFSGWGNISISAFELFALLFLKSTAGTMVLNAFATSFPCLGILGILSCFGLKFDGAEELDFLTIEPLPLVSEKMDTAVFAKDYDKIAAAFFSACSGNCGGRPALYITGEDILVKSIHDGKGDISGYILTDKKNVRHYEIGLSGDISLAPQFYFCAETIDLGTCMFYSGIFVCASMNFLGEKINIYLQIDEKNGIETLVNVAPIDCSWFRLMTAPQSTEVRGCTLIQPSDSLVNQYLYADDDGPTLYICAKKGDFSVYFTTTVEIIGIVSFSAHLLVDADCFLMDACAELFGLNARITLDAVKGSPEMYFMAELDLSAFRNITQKVINTVKKAVAKFQSKLADADSRLAYAEEQALKLQDQISAVDSEIKSLTDQLRSLKWWQFYKAPYLTVLIGAKELEKAGIYIALGAAMTALEIARDALKLVEQTSAHMDELIAMLAAAISSIFFIKRTVLEIGTDKSKNITLNMELCFTLFGQDDKISAGIPTGGDVKGRIVSTADSRISDAVDRELRKYDKVEKTLHEVSTSIFDYLSGSDFIYSDCNGYRQCLKNGLDFVNKAAVTEAIMEQHYKQAFKGDDPMSDIHSGRMFSRLSETKAVWQSVFGSVSEIDCDAIIEETEAELLGRNTMLGENAGYVFNSLDKLKEKAASLKRLQKDIYNNRSKIDDMDRNYIAFKDEMKNSTLYSRYASEDERPSGNPAYDYCRSLLELFSAKEELYQGGLINRRAFVLNDEENYFINPANEPALDRLFASVCENLENEEIRRFAGRIHADAGGKSNPHSYRIRI